MKMNKSNQSGMALIMVMSSIAIMTYLLADFTFNTKISRLKVYNLQDKTQARLTAEAGLNLALGKLRLYREARNLIEKNSSLKGMITPSTIEDLATSMFIYPIPVMDTMSGVQKATLEKFMEESLLEGNLVVDIQKVTGLINPNLMRIPEKKETDKNQEDDNNDNQDENEDSESNSKKNTSPPNVFVEKKLIEIFTRKLRDKKESMENFDEVYGDPLPENLVKELKFYVNDENSIDDPYLADITSLYQQNEKSLKYGPLTSKSELYQLQGWNDAIVDLIKDDLSIYNIAYIAVNSITEDHLKIIFPDITETQVEEFFKERDGDKELEIEENKFKTVADFKTLITGKLAIISSQDFDDRLKQLSRAGLRLGIASNLYKVTSSAEYGRSKYILEAIIDIPVAPAPIKQKKKKKKPAPKTGSDKDRDKENNDESDKNIEDRDQENNDKDKKKKKSPTQFLAPRIISIKVK